MKSFALKAKLAFWLLVGLSGAYLIVSAIIDLIRILRG
jgi:hypothetical protein